MYNIIIIVLSILAVTAALVFAAHFLPSRKLDLENGSPYECGFDPLNSARVPFSFRFFLVAILFLLFDLEIALLFPFPQALFIFNSSHVLYIATLFLAILLIGLIFEWTQGGLDWAE
uniref:NADH-ubiquinone oxidoreductase chain 3 n=1 Tax=Pisaster ochraceus TaxID=7612 RepID=NU3M_PISOC|nr:RecName: Full=NADH-ubiquinone oxidoreductase chain 3; AltName: Full=NADH dehydrogenase subunit 3 [Pisaster ochraceus]CAA39130.1 NADH dehydrogenase subunit 3 [Pisaster ochraceus]